VRFHWLLPSFLSIFLLALPAEAARLLTWRFNASRNQLAFTTDEGVQPRAQLIFNPTRVVIDLPGTTLGRSTATQPIGGAIRSLRVGQFNPQTTRLVIELSPGYTLDPEQVKFRGIAPNQWTVQLPTPQRLDQAPPPRLLDRTPQPSPPSRPAPNPPIPQRQAANNSGEVAQIENVRLTEDGIFIRTTGNVSELEVKRRKRRRVEIDLQNVTLSPQLRELEKPINRYGISTLELDQRRGSPPVVRVRLNIDKNSPDWQASISDFGGVVLLPDRRTIGATDRSPTNGATPSPASSPAPSVRPVAPPTVTAPPPTATSPTPTRIPPPPQSRQPSVPRPAPSPVRTNRLATIRSVQLGGNDTRLLVASDRPITSRESWQGNIYRITIPSAQLADQVKGPELSATSSVKRVRLQQQNENTVVILVEPAVGARLGRISQPNPRLLSLEIRPPRRLIVVDPPNRTPIRTPDPIIGRPNPPRNGRLLVMLDPGHGGKDPGAIGIRGLREKDVILPIALRVATLLQQQGVQPVLTRNNDRFVTLDGRVQMAARYRATLFVSIHANAINLSRPDVNGLETYYYSSGAGLAQTIHNSVLRSVNIRNRGIRRARFYVLRKTSMPAVLVEVGFVTGAEDAPKLANAQHRERLAVAIANGILQYLRRNY